MAEAIIGLCTIEFYLPGVASLKEKRGILKSMMARMHNKFNISAAEVAEHDRWQSAVIAVAVVSNSGKHCQQIINSTIAWIESQYPDLQIVDQSIEVL